MAQIIPIKRIPKTRLMVYRATNELFGESRIPYEKLYIPDPKVVLDLVVGVAKTALETNQSEYDRVVDNQNNTKELWRRRSVGRKISNFFRRQSLDKILSEDVPLPNIETEASVLHSRNVSGNIRIGHNREYEPAIISVTDRYLSGNLVVDGHNFELDPTDRLVRVDMTIPRSDTTQYDSLVTYSMYPDGNQVQTKLTKIHDVDLESVSYPSVPEDYDGDLVSMMLLTMNGLRHQIS